MSGIKEHKVCFYLPNDHRMMAMLRMQSVPRTGEVCVFGACKHEVLSVEWCLDEDATERGTLVNIELSAAQQQKKPEV